MKPKLLFSSSNLKNVKGGCCPIFSRVANKPMFLKSEYWLKTKNKKMYTVVKWGHTEGIEREKTSSQKSTVIALDFWILVFQIWRQNTIGGQFLEHYHLIWNCPWFLKRWWLLLNLSNLRALPAKSKCKNALRFLMKNTSFASLRNNFLYLF